MEQRRAWRGAGGLPAPSGAPVPRRLLKGPTRISQGQLKGVGVEESGGGGGGSGLPGAGGPEWGAQNPLRCPGGPQIPQSSFPSSHGTPMLATQLLTTTSLDPGPCSPWGPAHFLPHPPHSCRLGLRRGPPAGTEWYKARSIGPGLCSLRPGPEGEGRLALLSASASPPLEQRMRGHGGLGGAKRRGVNPFSPSP